MSSRARSSSAPGSRGGRTGRRPTSAPPQPRHTGRVSSSTAPPPKAASKAKLTGRAAIVLLVVAVLAVSYASSMRAWLQQRSDINTLTTEIAQRKAEVTALQLAKHRWHDPAYIQTQARLRFGWLMPGETGYRIIDGDGNIWVSGSELSDPVALRPKTHPEWWETVWGSIVAAGRDPVEVAARQVRKVAKRPVPVDQIGGGPHRGYGTPDGSIAPGDRLFPDSGEGVERR